MCLVGLLAVQGCAAGTGSGGAGGGASTTSSTTSASATSTTTSTTAQGGGGGSGGIGGMGGQTTTSSTDSTSSTSTTSSTGQGGAGGTGGGGPVETLVLLAGGGASMMDGKYTVSGNWSVATFGTGTSHTPGIALSAAAVGVGLFRSSVGNSLLFSKWDGDGFANPLSIGMTAMAQSGPSIVTMGQGAFAVYLATDNKHMYTQYAGPMGGWSLAQPVIAGADQSIGESEPDVAAVGADIFLAHSGTDGMLYEQRFNGATWEKATAHNVSGIQKTIGPTIIPLSGGAQDLLILYVVAANAQIGWTARTPGSPPTWSTPTLIANALTQSRVSAAPLENGGAVIAFRGLNTDVYTSLFDPNGSPSWSGPSELANPNFATVSPPAVAPGLTGADAELAFIDAATGVAKHCRLQGGTWTAPLTIGGVGLQFVRLAKSP